MALDTACSSTVCFVGTQMWGRGTQILPLTFCAVRDVLCVFGVERVQTLGIVPSWRQIACAGFSAGDL